MQIMSYKLLDWGPSPFSIKVRAILDYKGIAYRRASVLEFRNLLELRRRGVGKAPALDIGGRLIVDSTDIAHELEHLAPNPTIFPVGVHERAHCHVLEEWADESLYFLGLYFHWHDPEGRTAVPQVFGHTLAGRVMYRYYLHKILRQLQEQGIARKSPAHVLADAKRQLDAVAALTRGNAFLIGATPLLCDFALFGQLVYLGRSPVGARLLAPHAGIAAYVERIRALKQKRSDGAKST